MPRDDVSTSDLRLEAAKHVADAQAVLARDDIGEMERQILQCQHMEQYCSVMTQVALIEGDNGLLKTVGEQATKWATNMRAAATKRRNDEVPRLIEAMKDRRQFARDLLGVEEVD